MSDNVVELVQEAQKRGKFNLADAIKGRAFPEKTIDVYLDAGSAFELKQTEEKIVDLAKLGKSDAELESKMEELSKKILDSKLTFHMRGVGQSTVESVTQKSNELFPDSSFGDENWLRYYLCALVAENIVKVVDAEGNEDDSKFSPEDIMQVRGNIPIDSWEVIVDTMQKLTLASSYFDAITDANFLQKS